MVQNKGTRDYLQPCGLINKGNTCFFNSVIQSLLSLNFFIIFFKEQTFNSRKQPFSYAFKEFIYDYQNNKVLDPQTLINALRKRINLFDGNQQDAHCFSEFFINKLIEEQGKKNNLLASMFRIVNKDIVNCQLCDFSKTIINEMNDKYLFIEQTVTKSLNSYEEKIDTVCKDSLWRCPKCDKSNQATIKHNITEVSEIFIIHLHRFEGINKKSNKEIEINDEINITGKLYEIKAVVCHNGNLNSGHYYAKAKRNNIWYNFNDSKVTKIDFSVVKSTPYLLFYVRKMM